MDQCYMRKRFVSLYESQKFSDCYFLIDNEKILAHKIILASSSPVFEAMLYGPLASCENEINDINAQDFRQMLMFIYTDTINLVSIVNAWAIVYIAKKYLILDLLHLCLIYIRKNLRASNVLLSYEFANLFNEDSICNLCMNHVRMYAKIILNSDYHMKSTTLSNLLDQDEFNANETELINTTIKWASIECQLQKIDSSKENIRLILHKSGIFSKIRFLSFPVDEISSNQLLLELLTDEEINTLKSYKIFAYENKSKLKHLNLCLNCNPRSTIPLLQKMGFRRVFKAGDVFHANTDSKLTTQLIANKSVIINGLLLPSRSAPETCLSQNYSEYLNITITDVVSDKTLRLSCAQTLKYGTVHTVKITEPFLFEEGRRYDIDIMWSSLSYMEWANKYTMHYLSPSLVHEDVEFEFHDPFDCGFIQGVCYYQI